MRLGRVRVQADKSKRRGGRGGVPSIDVGGGRTAGQIISDASAHPSPVAAAARPSPVAATGCSNTDAAVVTSAVHTASHSPVAHRVPTVGSPIGGAALPITRNLPVLHGLLHTGYRLHPVPYGLLSVSYGLVIIFHGPLRINLHLSSVRVQEDKRIAVHHPVRRAPLHLPVKNSAVQVSLVDHPRWGGSKVRGAAAGHARVAFTNGTTRVSAGLGNGVLVLPRAYWASLTLGPPTVGDARRSTSPVVWALVHGVTVGHPAILPTTAPNADVVVG